MRAPAFGCAGECMMPFDAHFDRDRPVTVLLVDDDIDSRDMYAAALAFAGVQSHVADDVDTAFDLAVSMQPDVIVTDFVLKGEQNGAALCRRLHADPRTPGSRCSSSRDRRESTTPRRCLARAARRSEPSRFFRMP